MLFSVTSLHKRKIHFIFSGANYYFFKLNNLVIFNLNVVSLLVLDDRTLFIELTKNKISFLFFSVFAKYINKLVNLRLLAKRSYADSNLEMQGLGFEIYRITKRIYRFFCGYVSYIYLLVPEEIEILNSTRKKKKLWIRGRDLHVVNNFINMLKLLKGFSEYRAVGFYEPRVLIRLRNGKKK